MPAGQVDGRLAADRRVHRREQGGGHLYELYTAQIDCGGKPGHIARDAAAERDDEIAAGTGNVRERVQDRIQRRKRFGRFAGREYKAAHRKARAAQARLQRPARTARTPFRR